MGTKTESLLAEENGMRVTLEIQRFDPATDASPRFASYTVEVEPTDRVLDALLTIRRTQDSTLGFRKSCAHGVCGSDAMRIDGKERLACKTLFQDLDLKDGEAIRIEHSGICRYSAISWLISHLSLRNSNRFNHF